MIRLIGAMHPEGPGGAGFATAIIDPLAHATDLSFWKVAFNQMHTNTGLSDADWATRLGSPSGIAGTLNDMLTRMSSVTGGSQTRKRGTEEDWAGTLSDRINLVAEQVRLSADGTDPRAARPNLANPMGGFTAFDAGSAFNEMPGVFCRNVKYLPRATAGFPIEGLWQTTWDEAVTPWIRADLAMAWSRAQRDPKFWGPTIFKDQGGTPDPRNRIPGAIDLQRAIHVWSMAYFHALQPQMVIAHCIWRFLFGGASGPSSSPAYEVALRRVDKRSLDDLEGLLKEICSARIGLTPVWARALQPMGWRKLTLRWGEMNVCYLPPELADLTDVYEVFSDSSRIVKFVKELYRTLKRDNLMDIYTSLNTWMGMVQPLGDYTAPSPLMAELYYTDGLHCSASIRHELDLWFRPFFMAYDHLGVSTDRPRAMDVFADFEAARAIGNERPMQYDRQPTLQFEPNSASYEGSIQELGSPFKWRLLNGDYQGDVGETSIKGDIDTMASMVGLDPAVLTQRIGAQFERWSHLFDRDSAGVIVPRSPGARFFRSLRTELWWRKSFKPNVQLIDSYYRWLDGKKLHGDPSYTQDATIQSNNWYGLQTPERADLPSTVESAFTSLRAIL